MNCLIKLIENVILESISSTFYVQIFRTNVVSAAFPMYMQLEKSCQNNVRTKNLYIVDEIEYR